jgi:hypothetical protein
MMDAAGHEPLSNLLLLFPLGVLVALYFGFRFNIRALQYLTRLDMRLRGDRPPNFLEAWLLAIRLEETMVRDAIGLVVGIAIAFAAIGFWWPAREGYSP